MQGDDYSISHAKQPRLRHMLGYRMCLNRNGRRCAALAQTAWCYLCCEGALVGRLIKPGLLSCGLLYIYCLLLNNNVVFLHPQTLFHRNLIAK